MSPRASLGPCGALLALSLGVIAGLAGLAAAAPGTGHARTVWLCKPGLAADPCSARLDTASFSPAGQPLGVRAPTRSRRPRIDCFYVYPTVSDQPRVLATRRVDPEQRSIARFQAARYARDCRMFAPMYRQVTLAGLARLEPRHWRRAYADVRAAWRAYLRRHNRGRGVVLIGHSQGTFHLTRLIAEEIEGRRRQRRRLVSALLLGGNVTVAPGRDAGGDFRRVRACRSPGQVGCVVAFSAFNAPVPPDAAFGRAAPGREVLCTNPAALAGGEGTLLPVYPREPFAPGTPIGALVAAMGAPMPASTATWLAFPGSYTGRCVNEGGANVLQVTPAPGAPALAPMPAPTWGLHLADANIALGNLAALVRGQAAAYLRARG
jgi:hypothetical protein